MLRIVVTKLMMAVFWYWDNREYISLLGLTSFRILGSLRVFLIAGVHHDAVLRLDTARLAREKISDPGTAGAVARLTDSILMISMDWTNSASNPFTLAMFSTWALLRKLEWSLTSQKGTQWRSWGC